MEDLQESEENEETVGRKGKANKDLWNRNIIKKARVKGVEFVDPKGNIVPKKTTGNACR